MGNVPEIIHYCWFGRGRKSREIQSYIKGWKKKLPSYEFMEWNEDTFEYEKIPFAAEAYQQKKYAFVSDVARVYALYHYGGVYLDTDVEILRDFSELCKEGSLILGFEYGGKNLMTAFLASIPHHPVMGEMLSYYHQHLFGISKENYYSIANTYLLTDLLRKQGLCLNNKQQSLEDGIVVFPEEYFSAYELRYEKNLRGSNTYTVHHFSASWMPLDIRMKKRIKKLLSRLLGADNFRKLLSGRQNVR